MSLCSTKAIAIADFCKIVSYLTDGPSIDSEDVVDVADNLLSHIIDEIDPDATKTALSEKCDIYFKAVLFLRQNSVHFVEVSAASAREGDRFMIAKILVLVVNELRLSRRPLFLEAREQMFPNDYIELLHILRALDSGANGDWIKTLDKNAETEFLVSLLREDHDVPPTTPSPTPSDSDRVEEVRMLTQKLHHVSNLLCGLRKRNNVLLRQNDRLNTELLEMNEYRKRLGTHLCEFGKRVATVCEKDKKIKELQTECQSLRAEMEFKQQQARRVAESMAQEIASLHKKNEQSTIQEAYQNLTYLLKKTERLRDENAKVMDEQKCFMKKFCEQDDLNL